MIHVIGCPACEEEFDPAGQEDVHCPTCQSRLHVEYDAEYEDGDPRGLWRDRTTVRVVADPAPIDWREVQGCLEHHEARGA